jgi:hypothetical protein
MLVREGEFENEMAIQVSIQTLADIDCILELVKKRISEDFCMLTRMSLEDEDLTSSTPPLASLNLLARFKCKNIHSIREPEKVMALELKAERNDSKPIFKNIITQAITMLNKGTMRSYKNHGISLKADTVSGQRYILPNSEKTHEILAKLLSFGVEIKFVDNDDNIQEGAPYAVTL